MALFKNSGRVFKPQDDVFSENSWVQVMMGQGLMPEGYHNIADAMTREQLGQYLGQLEAQVAQQIAGLPTHEGYVQQLLARSGA
jgi:tryptophan halogenase